MAFLSPDNKRLFRKIDFELLIAALAIVIYSIIIISSATHVNTPSEERFWFVQRQGLFAFINIMLAIFFMNFDYRGLQQYGNQLYIFNLIMLLAVMLFGQAALGAQRWIQLGPISLQPSEFSKLIMIICLASVLEDRVGRLNSLHDLFPIAVYVGVPFLLVLKQPDLGTSLVFMAILRHPHSIVVGNIFGGLGVDAGVVAFHERLSKNAHHGISRSERRPARLGISHHSIEDRNRLGNVIRQRAVRGHAEPIKFPAGESHGFYFCGGRRGIGLRRRGRPVDFIFDRFMARHSDCARGG